MPDVQGKLDEIITMVETAKSKALSGSACIVDRTALLGALEELRHLLPAEMSEARSVLRERTEVQEAARAQADTLLGQARAEAERTVAAAQQERDRLVAESEVVDEAERVAAEITNEAEAQAVQMREQTDGYIDASLARFEQLLASSLETVARGRARVAASRAAAEQELPLGDAGGSEGQNRVGSNGGGLEFTEAGRSFRPADESVYGAPAGTPAS
jgi:cell division septum initiation protein DivIVA